MFQNKAITLEVLFFIAVVISIAIIIKNGLEAVSRNPDHASTIQRTIFFGLVFIEFTLLLFFAFAGVKAKFLL